MKVESKWKRVAIRICILPAIALLWVVGLSFTVIFFWSAPSVVAFMWIFECKPRFSDPVMGFQWRLVGAIPFEATERLAEKMLPTG